MSSSVSLRTTPSTEQPQQPAEEKSAFAERVSASFNYNQAITLVVIAFLVFLPLGAAGVALAMPRNVIPQSPPGLQSSNGTCPTLQISPAAIRSYLRHGNSEAYSSAAAREIEDLQLEDFKENRFDSEQTKQRRLDEKKCELLTEAAVDFLKTADGEDHPAAKALALHQATDALEQAKGLSYDYRIRRDLGNRVEKLRAEEADACYESAKLAETPEEKLSWAARGLLELKVPLNPYESNPFSLRDNLPACDAAASLFYTAGQSFKQLDPQKYYDHAALVRSNRMPISDARTQIAAAECLKYAGYYSRFSGNSEDTQATFDESIEVVKSIDTSSIPLEEQVELQERIVSTSIAARNAAEGMQPALSARIVSESLIAEKMYQQLIESEKDLATYYTIQRAISLENAAYYAPNLTSSVELYREATGIVQDAWSQHPDECLDIRDFANRRYSLLGPSFTIENSLLGRLRSSTLQVEQQLAKESAGVLRSAWNRISNWFN